MRRLAGPLGEAGCDLVIDIDRFALEAACRARIEARLRDLTAMEISFVDLLEREAESIELQSLLKIR